MKVNTKYDLGQTVFLRTDKEQYPYIIVEIVILDINMIIYGLRSGEGDIIYRNSYEISENEDKLIKFGCS